MMQAPDIDDVDRQIIGKLQRGMPVTPRPYRDAAEGLGLSEDDLLARLRSMLDRGVLTRFGPMFNADLMGGAFCLCAMAVPEERFDEVADIVNGFPQVAHNYQREHALNMWFVLATETLDEIGQCSGYIERATGLEVLQFPKKREFFIGLMVKV